MNLKLSLLLVVLIVFFGIIDWLSWSEVFLIPYVSFGINWAYLYALKPKWTFDLHTKINPLTTISRQKEWYRWLQVIIAIIWPIGLTIEVICSMKESWRHFTYEYEI